MIVRNMDGIDRQNVEFDALNELIKAYNTLMKIAVVDDDYPEYRHKYESRMKTFIEAIKTNGRI